MFILNGCSKSPRIFNLFSHTLSTLLRCFHFIYKNKNLGFEFDIPDGIVIIFARLSVTLLSFPAIRRMTLVPKPSHHKVRILLGIKLLYLNSDEMISSLWHTLRYLYIWKNGFHIVLPIHGFYKTMPISSKVIIPLISNSYLMLSMGCFLNV